MQARKESHCGCETQARKEMHCGCDCDGARLTLQKLEFAINDVVLYLDAYPDSAPALAYYQKLIAERNALRETIKADCGPMTIYENTSCDGWTWVNGPWPWQIDAN